MNHMTPHPPTGGPGRIIQRHLLSSTNEDLISPGIRELCASQSSAQHRGRGQPKEADKDRAEAQSSDGTEVSWGGVQEEMHTPHQSRTLLHKRAGNARRLWPLPGA